MSIRKNKALKKRKKSIIGKRASVDGFFFAQGGPVSVGAWRTATGRRQVQVNVFPTVPERACRLVRWCSLMLLSASSKTLDSVAAVAAAAAAAGWLAGWVGGA